jgi:superfamily I DNA/RNA helicase
MSYQVTNTFIRPNTSVNFHIANIPDSYIQYIVQNYKNTNKIVNISTDLSADSLTLTATWLWSNQAEFNAYTQDSVVVQHRSERDAWNTANGITMTQAGVEV